MIKFAAINAVGDVLYSGETVELPNTPDIIFVELDEVIQPAEYFYDFGKQVFKKRPPYPSTVSSCVSYTFDPSDELWILDTTKTLNQLRSVRDTKLFQSDWTQMSDSPLSPEKKQEWATYRQALRDFPGSCDLENPVWPTPPQ